MVISIKKYFKELDRPDILNQIFLIFITAIILLNYNKIPNSFLFAFINIIFSFIIIFITGSYSRGKFKNPLVNNSLKIFRYWYPIFTILFYFKEIYLIMINVETRIYDDVLINIDKIIFGANPTDILMKISNPYLTEFLQIIYFLFYVSPIIFGLELYLWHRYEEFKYAMFLILLGFYLSFIGYLILPAVGPRFTLYDFSNLSNELPGVYLTEFLRKIINLGESIYPLSAANPIDVAQRDAFPSGHTIIVSCIAYLSYKFNSKSYYFYLPFLLLMIFATVYLRYHYVIDIISGLLVAFISILISNYTFRNKNLSAPTNSALSNRKYFLNKVSNNDGTK